MKRFNCYHYFRNIFIVSVFLLIVLYKCNFTLEILNFLMRRVNLPMLVVKLLSCCLMNPSVPAV